jgi:uncharacterized RDD family membrane protein YckC
MQTINVRTTQNVFIEYPVASLGDRVVANLIDSVIVVAYVIVVALVMDSVTGSLDATAEWIAMAAIFLPALLYHLLFEIFMDGQSPGKRVMEIKVVRTDGTSPTIGNYVMRWILRLIEIRLFWGLIALVAIAAGGRGQRLGDMAADTTVVKLIRERDATASEVFTLTHGQYTPVFHQVLALNDRDIELIQQAIHVYSETGNAQPMNVIGRKIETKLGINTEMEAVNFLNQIIKDYAHLSAAK